MDDETSVLEWAIDAGAALTLAVAAGWSAARIGGAVAAVAAAATALLVAAAFLRLAGGAGRRFRPAGFSPIDWEDALQQASDPTVVALLASPRLTAPAEMQQRIAHHLATRTGTAEADAGGGDVVLLGADASAALRSALGELKRSLR